MFNIARTSLAAAARRATVTTPTLANRCVAGGFSRAMSSETATFDLTGSFEVRKEGKEEDSTDDVILLTNSEQKVQMKAFRHSW